MCCWRCYHAEGMEWAQNSGEMTLGLGKSHTLTKTQLAELHAGFRGMWQMGPADADGNPTMVFKKLKCSTYCEDGGRVCNKKRARASVPATEEEIDDQLVCCHMKHRLSMSNAFVCHLLSGFTSHRNTCWPLSRGSAQTRVPRSKGFTQKWQRRLVQKWQRRLVQKWQRRLVQHSKQQVMQREGMIANTCMFVDVVPFVMLRHL